MKTLFTTVLIQWILLFAPNTQAAMNHGGMIMDASGMIMNANKDRLPRDCKQISEDLDLTVHAGQKHARKFNGKVFAYDQQQWEVKACTRINVTFINDDHVRHQFMIHGLPGYLYPKGMFTIEINGKGQKQASFIVPANPKTYLVHCDISQHTAKGMKAQLKVAGGDKDLPSIPGLTAPAKADSYGIDWTDLTWLVLLVALLTGFALPFVFWPGGKTKN